jgi:hypothetical protein
VVTTLKLQIALLAEATSTNLDPDFLQEPWTRSLADSRTLTVPSPSKKPAIHSCFVVIVSDTYGDGDNYQAMSMFLLLISTAISCHRTGVRSCSDSFISRNSPPTMLNLHKQSALQLGSCLIHAWKA